METPNYYKARISLYQKLIDELPDTEDKHSPRELLKSGYWSESLGDERTKVLEHAKVLQIQNVFNGQTLNDVSPLLESEKMKYSTWFAMHPEKIAGKEIVTTSRDFPIRIKGTVDDIVRTIQQGLVKQSTGASTNLRLKLKLKAKALKLKLKL